MAEVVFNILINYVTIYSHVTRTLKMSQIKVSTKLLHIVLFKVCKSTVS